MSRVVHDVEHRHLPAKGGSCKQPITKLQAVQIFEKAAANPESDNYENKNQQSNKGRREQREE
jgi:hypothetical protein